MKMNRLQNAKGYSLLLSLVLVLLFSVLGLGLIGVTMNGAKKNETREDVVQAEDLASKGIINIPTNIQSDINLALGLSGMDIESFKLTLDKKIGLYSCDTNKGNPIYQGRKSEIKYDFRTCVSSWSDEVYYKDNKKMFNPLRKIIKIESRGQAGSMQRVIHSTFNIGASQYPEILNYVVSTNTTNKNRINGEGNLLLSGNVSITGDLKVDGDLITSDAYYFPLSLKDDEKVGFWTGDIPPEIHSTRENDSPKLILSGDFYKYSSLWYINYFTHLNNSTYSNRYMGHPDNSIEDLFIKNFSPEITKRSPINTPILIEEYKNSFYINENSAGTTQYRTGSNRTISIGDINYANLSVRTHDKTRIHARIDIKFRLTGNNKFKKFSTKGNLTIQNGSSIIFSEGLFVKGDLIIGAECPTNCSNEVTIQGAMYVEGNIIIDGVNLKSDILLYASNPNKEVSISKSTISSKNLGGDKKGSLIIFSKGPISTILISSNSNLPSEINGYFYTEKEFKMYGVESNILLKGGISAKRIALSAKQENGLSRLQIKYDSNIINRYSDLRIQEPIIKSLAPPIELSRGF